MKLYHILDHFIPHYSGYTFRTRYILNFQKELGIEVGAITSPLYSDGLKQKEIIDGIPFFRSQMNGVKSKLPFLREMSVMGHLQKDILSVLKSDSADIIHAHSPLLCGFPAFNAAKKLRLPVIYEVRALWEDAAVDLGRTTAKSMRYHLTRYLETQLLNKVDKVITICEGLKKELIERGIKEEKIYVIPNGVDAKKFTPLDKDKELINKYALGNKIILGFIGSFYKYEGLIHLINAMPKILAQHKDAVLFLIGEGNEEKLLKDLAFSLNLESNVIFTGKVSHEEILKYYSIIDILVYPRKKIRLTELTTPLKLLEAMAMEKAVIGSDVGGIKELIKNRKTGILFEPNNLDDLADKISYLIQNGWKRKELGQQARINIVQNRDWSRIIPKYLEIYEALIRRSLNENY